MDKIQGTPAGIPHEKLTKEMVNSVVVVTVPGPKAHSQTIIKKNLLEGMCIPLFI